jgi:hypothetical protein
MLNSKLPSFTLILSLCVYTAVAAGCSEKQSHGGRALVMGEVTLDGNPLSAGTITFMSHDNANVNAVPIDGGAYRTDGAPLGECRVTVDTDSVPGAEKAGLVVPERYRDPAKSELKATIESGENFGLNFALTTP